MSDAKVWSDALARALLAAIADEEIASYWGVVASPGSPRVRDELCAWARGDAEVRQWIAAGWRDRNESVVDETESYAPEELAERVEAVCDQFGADALVLALLTDEAARGTDLAEAFVRHTASAKHRQAIAAALGRLTGAAAAAPQAMKRVIVFGGHPRDEANLDEPLSNLGPFEIRWETFERTSGGGAADTRSITAALVGAHAAIVVLGMASHALASVVRAQTQAYGIPYRTVNRATRRQLTEVLSRLFPEA